MVLEAWEVEAPEFAGTEMTIVDFEGEVEVYTFDIFGKDSGAGTQTNGKEL